MSNDYDVGQPQPRPMTREPYRGPRIRSRSTGEVKYWVGDRYVSENSPDRLTTQERTARQSALDNANRFGTMLPDLNRFEELNRTVPTGSVTQRAGQFFGNMPRLLYGLDNPATPQSEPQGYDEMRAIVSRLTPSQRVEGSGSSSNLDVGMFREGLPNMGNSGPANSRIIEGYRRQAQDAREYADFIDWYWPRTGSLTNADSEFARYRQARSSNPELNWRQFFRADAAPGGGGQQGETQAGSGGRQRQNSPPRPRNVPPNAQWDPDAREWVAP
jgi:hypothetical protein